MKTIETRRFRELEDYWETTKLTFRTDFEFPWSERITLDLNRAEITKDTQGLVLNFNPRSGDLALKAKQMILAIVRYICMVASQFRDS